MRRYYYPDVAPDHEQMTTLPYYAEYREACLRAEIEPRSRSAWAAKRTNLRRKGYFVNAVRVKWGEDKTSLVEKYYPLGGAKLVKFKLNEIGFYPTLKDIREQARRYSVNLGVHPLSEEPLY